MSEKQVEPPARFFLDANVLISGLLFRGPERELLLAAEAGLFQALTSDYVLREVERVLRDKFRLPAEAVEEALETLPVQRTPDPADGIVAEAEAVLRDPADAPVLAAAWEAGVKALVTGDQDLLTVEESRLQVLTAPAALDLLTEE